MNRQKSTCPSGILRPGAAVALRAPRTRSASPPGKRETFGNGKLLDDFSTYPQIDSQIVHSGLQESRLFPGRGKYNFCEQEVIGGVHVTFSGFVFWLLVTSGLTTTARDSGRENNMVINKNNTEQLLLLIIVLSRRRDRGAPQMPWAASSAVISASQPPFARSTFRRPVAACFVSACSALFVRAIAPSARRYSGSAPSKSPL